MIACRAGRIGLLLSALAALAPAGASAEDDPGAKKRLDVMRGAVENLDARAADLKPEALAPAPEPLLRYSDPTRGGVKDEFNNNVLVDATVWRLGAEGRPTGLVTLEIYRFPDGAQLLSYEFLSMTETRFALKHKTEEWVRWDATGSGLALKDLPDAPKPAATAPARMAQMRKLARRFGAKETYNGETVECRLIAQPIDRYKSDAQKITDGAIFALANGTNPEIGIVLECGAEKWSYGVLRLSGAKTAITLDDKVVVAYEKFDSRGRRDGPYNSASHKIAPEK